jgi:hypothetical protein
VEEILRLDGEYLDLKRLARSFPTGPIRVEEHEGFHYLFQESEAARDYSDVMADGNDTLAEMHAIFLAGDPSFRPPRISGVSHKLPDGSFGTVLRVSVNIQSRTALFIDPERVGPDGKVIENKGPTEDQIELRLAAKNEHLRRARIMYGRLKHDWGNLYKVLEAMEDGNGGEAGLIAKHFVADGEIKSFKATANSNLALGAESRHGTTTMGVPEARMTLEQAQAMFRKLFAGWTQELKDQENS